MNEFVRHHKVRFGETDYAGIMFYPRYFEGLNATVEDWFSDAVGISFGALLDDYKVGTPLVSVETKFLLPSRLGDDLEYRLVVSALGVSSITFEVVTICGEEKRMQAKMVHVCVWRDISASTPWPDKIHKKLKQACGEAQ